MSALPLDKLQARYIANAPTSSGSAKNHLTILVLLHFLISVAMYVMRFPLFMVPSIRDEPCHNLAEILF